jgi:hypothetical protein
MACDEFCNSRRDQLTDILTAGDTLTYLRAADIQQFSLDKLHV